MRALAVIASIYFSSAIVLATPSSARAACSTATDKYAWGDFWIERSGANCDCVVKATKYPCGATGGVRDPHSTTTLATLSGDCSKNCEDISGYDGRSERSDG